MSESVTDHRALRKRCADILRARVPLLVVDTPEETFAMGCLVAAAVDEDRQILSWSAVKGVSQGIFAGEHQNQSDTLLPAAGMRYLALGTGSRVLVLYDMVEHLDDAVNLRCLRELVEGARNSGSTVVLLHHGGTLPPVVASVAVPLAVPLPDRWELRSQMRDLLKNLKDHERVLLRLNNDHFEQMVDHLVGLTRQQAEQIVRIFAMDDRRLDVPDVHRIGERKRELLCSGGILDLVHSTGTLAQVAGFHALKAWLRLRAAGSERGLPAARGILLLGVPGAGKSLCAKAIAGEWRRSLLHLDAGALYDKYIGESERRLRTSLDQAETMAPCVLWIDEIEKAFASAAGRSSDGGLSQRMFGTLLNWMQEHRSDVFLVATANDIDALPPELLRKGRFDEIFFADLPDGPTRMEILRLHAQRQSVDTGSWDLTALAAASDGFSGAELEQALIAARYESDQGQPDQAAMMAAIGHSPPLSTTAGERIETLRHWASGRCVTT